MATGTLTSTDLQLRESVVRQLDWDPEVDASAIGVSAANGVITLTGFIDTYAGKLAAERVAKRVRGVRAVANDIDVRLRLERTDADIAAAAARALELRPAIADRVQVVVHNGHITLTGKVNWLFRKREAEKAVHQIQGVRSVINHIVIVPGPPAPEIRRRILQALQRDADLDARHVDVTVSGHTARLTGTVGTWSQRELAEHAAAGAPGVAFIDNQITVEPAAPAEGVMDEIC